MSHATQWFYRIFMTHTDWNVLYYGQIPGREVLNMKRFKPHGSGMFTLKDANGRGRCVMLTSSIICQINAWLTTGIFYTSFLMIYGIDLVNIGIITFIPYIASCFGIFSPSLLERFRKRRVLLVGARLLFHSLNILGITLVPALVHDPSARIVWLIIIVFLANLVNALTGSGFSVWHLNFIPNEIRAEFFIKQSTISNFIGIGISLLSGIVADALAASAYGNTIIIAFRYFAYAIAVLECVVLALPKEFPYPQSKSRPRLRDIFVMSFSSRPFILTMVVVLLHTFFMNIPSAGLNYYLLNDVGVQYTFTYAVNMVYPFMLILLQPLTRRLIGRYGWFKVIGVSLVLHAPTHLAYSFVTASNYLWLYTAVRLTQHVLGVALNTAWANIAFVNLPPNDQTNYISFHQLTSNISVFLGMMLGTALVAWIGDYVLVLGGFRFTSVQILLWLTALGNIIVPLFIRKHFLVLDPHAREGIR